MKKHRAITHQVDAVSNGQMQNKKKLLAIMHVLLNALTEIPCVTSTVITVMNAIERKTPLIPEAWHSNFEIIYQGKIIVKWNNGIIDFLS